MNKVNLFYLILFVIFSMPLISMDNQDRLYPDIYGKDAEDVEIQAAIVQSLEEKKAKEEKQQEQRISEEHASFRNASAPTEEELDEDDGIRVATQRSLEDQARKPLENSQTIEQKNSQQYEVWYVAFLKWLLSFVKRSR